MKISIEYLEPYLESLTSKQQKNLLNQLPKKDNTLMEQLYFKHLSTSEQLDERYEWFENEMKNALFALYRANSDELAVARP